MSSPFLQHVRKKLFYDKDTNAITIQLCTKVCNWIIENIHGKDSDHNYNLVKVARLTLHAYEYIYDMI